MPPPQLLVSIIELGVFAGLLGLAYLLVLEGAGFFNFALGPIAMFSGLAAAWLAVQHSAPLFVGVALGVGAAVGLSLITELGIVRPIHKRTGGAELPALVAVVAVLFAVEQFAGFLFGLRALPGQPWLSGAPIQVAGVFVAKQTIVLVVVTILIFVGVGLLLKYASYGRMLRAVGDNEHAAYILGLPVGRVRMFAFLLAGIIVGLAGPLISPKAGIGFQSGLGWAVIGFLALVIGGMGRLWAPLVGGLVLASVQVLGPFFFGGAAIDYLTILLALLFFWLRPQGIFARRVRT